MTLGNRIKTARKRLSMSQAVLARHIQVDQSSIAYWESGRTSPKFSRLVALAETLSVTPEWLQFGVESPTSAENIPVVANIGGASADSGQRANGNGAQIAFGVNGTDTETIAVTVTGDALAPVYFDGDVLIGSRHGPESFLEDSACDCVIGLTDGRALLVRSPAGRGVSNNPAVSRSAIKWVMTVSWIRRGPAPSVAEVDTAALQSLPLDRAGRFAGNVVDHPVDAAHLVDDAGGNPPKELVIEGVVVGRHAVG